MPVIKGIDPRIPWVKVVAITAKTPGPGLIAKKRVAIKKVSALSGVMGY